MKLLALALLLPAVSMAGIPINVPSRNAANNPQGRSAQAQMAVTVTVLPRITPYIHYMTITTINGERVVYRVVEY